MKKSVLFFAAVIVITAILFSSCHKDDEPQPETPVNYIGDIFYVSSTTPQSITCSWDEIDYDTCFFIIEKVETIMANKEPLGAGGLQWFYTTSGNDYSFIFEQKDLEAFSNKPWAIHYDFHRNGHTIKQGYYICKSTDSNFHFIDGSLMPGYIGKFNGKKWYFLQFRSQKPQYACNLDYLVKKTGIREKSGETTIYSDSIISINIPFRGVRVATDEDFLALEKAIGMPENELYTFAPNRGKNVYSAAAFFDAIGLESPFITSPLILVDNDGEIVLRHLGQGITRVKENSITFGSLVYIEE